VLCLSIFNFTHYFYHTIIHVINVEAFMMQDCNLGDRCTHQLPFHPCKSHLCARTAILCWAVLYVPWGSSWCSTCIAISHRAPHLPDFLHTSSTHRLWGRKEPNLAEPMCGQAAEEEEKWFPPPPQPGSKVWVSSHDAYLCTALSVGNCWTILLSAARKHDTSLSSNLSASSEDVYK